MKTSITKLFAFLIALGGLQTLSAQITISRADYPKPPAYIDSSLYTTDNSITYPIIGANQFWDYSAFTNNSISISNGDSSRNLTDFPTSFSQNDFSVGFQTYTIDGIIYYGINNQNFHELGFFYHDTAYNIANRTGGPNDTLRFVEGPKRYSAQNNLLVFPINYLDSNYVFYSDSIEYELTVAAFGLNKTPGNFVTYTEIIDEVVGYGEMIIPDYNNLPSDSVEVLLTRVYTKYIDSTFLGGSPAPPTLMAAFGLTQGYIYYDTTYRFQAKNASRNIANITFNDRGTAGVDAFFYPDKVRNATGIEDLKTEINLTNYPNPIEQGEVLTIQSETSLVAAQIRLLDITGKIVNAESLNIKSGKTASYRIPSSVVNGIYFYQISDNNGNILAVKKLIIK